MSFYDLSIYLSAYILATGLIGWILSVVEKKRKAVAVDSGRGPQHLPRMFQTPATWGKVVLLSVIAVVVIFLLMMVEERLDFSSPAYDSLCFWCSMSVSLRRC